MSDTEALRVIVLSYVCATLFVVAVLIWLKRR